MTHISSNNYIDFSVIEDAEKTLKLMPKTFHFEKINTQASKRYIVDLDEYRTELYDDRINFLELTEPKIVNYININSQLLEWPMTHDPEKI